MDPSLLLPYVMESDPWVFVTLLVFLLLTKPRQGRNRGSRRTVGTGRHREPDAGDPVDESDERPVSHSST